MKLIRADQIKVNDMILVKTDIEYSIGKIVNIEKDNCDKVMLWARWRDFNIKTKKEEYYKSLAYWGSRDGNTIKGDEYNYPIYLLKGKMMANIIALLI